MEVNDQTLVQKLCDANPRFRMLFEEHRILERELENFNSKPYLTPEEEIEKKKVQKLKLAGKDEMERIMSVYRQ